MIEDTRHTNWEDEVETFTCELCSDDFYLTGLEITIHDKRVCNTCADEIYHEYKYMLDKSRF